MNIRPELLRRCAKNDRNAHRELYEMLYSPLLTVSRRYYRNEEDAVSAMHNAFMKILSKIHKYRYEKSFINWAKTLLIRTILDEFRSNRKRRELEILVNSQLYLVSEGEVIVNEVEKLIETDHINKILEVLPNSTRLVFNLFVFEEFTHREIAKKLRISEGTSKWHVAHARSKLQLLLSQRIQPTNPLTINQLKAE